jgi:hypothetical protein
LEQTSLAPSLSRWVATETLWKQRSTAECRVVAASALRVVLQTSPVSAALAASTGSPGFLFAFGLQTIFFWADLGLPPAALRSAPARHDRQRAPAAHDRPPEGRPPRPADR